MEKKMEKGRNLMKKENYYLKVHIWKGKNGKGNL